jgi:predicted nucleotidyltransferase
MKITAVCRDRALQEALDRLIRTALVAGRTLRLTADGSSMQPMIRPGDILEIQGAASESIRRGDIIALRRGMAVQVHRVLRTEHCGEIFRFLTRGDFSPTVDGWFDSSLLIGRVSVVRRGERRMELRTHGGRLKSAVLGVAGRFSRHCTDLRTALAWQIVRTRNIPPLAVLYHGLYGFALHVLLFRLRRLSDIRTLYLRGSYSRGDWIPGLSDIDITVIFRGDVTAPARRFWRCYEQLKKFFPFLGEARLADVPEFRIWQQFDYQSADFKDWKLLFGQAASAEPPVFHPLKVKLDALLELETRLILLSRPATRWFLQRRSAAAEDLFVERLLGRIAECCKRLAETEEHACLRLSAQQPLPMVFLSLYDVLARVLQPIVPELRAAGLLMEDSSPSAALCSSSSVLLRDDVSSVNRLLLAVDCASRDFFALRNDESLRRAGELKLLLPLRCDIQNIFHVNALANILRYLEQPADPLLAEALLKREVSRFLGLLSRASNPRKGRSFTTSDSAPDDLAYLTEDILRIRRAARQFFRRQEKGKGLCNREPEIRTWLAAPLTEAARQEWRTVHAAVLRQMLLSVAYETER